MRHSPTLFTAVLLLLLLGGIHVAQGDDKPTSNDLGNIQPPGGTPLPIVGPKGELTVEGGNKVRKRLEAAPAEALDKWVVELERIMDQKLEGDLAKQACRTYFVTRMSVAFDDLKWNAKAADNLFQRAQTMPSSEAKVWKKAFEALLKKEIGQTATTYKDGGPAFAVPLVLISVKALHEGHKYSVERGQKYLARLKQLTADDVSLWKDKVDKFGGTKLDAAINIILLDDYFDKEQFQRDKFKAAIGARKPAGQLPKEDRDQQDPKAAAAERAPNGHAQVATKDRLGHWPLDAPIELRPRVGRAAIDQQAALKNARQYLGIEDAKELRLTPAYLTDNDFPFLRPQKRAIWLVEVRELRIPAPRRQAGAEQEPKPGVLALLYVAIDAENDFGLSRREHNRNADTSVRSRQ